MTPVRIEPAASQFPVIAVKHSTTEPLRSHGSFEHPKHIFKLMDWKIFTILHSKILFCLNLCKSLPCNPVIFICHSMGIFLHAFLPSADFFKINFFEKFVQEYHHRMCLKQFGSRPHAGFVKPAWVQTVSKVYQQTTP